MEIHFGEDHEDDPLWPCPRGCWSRFDRLGDRANHGRDCTGDKFVLPKRKLLALADEEGNGAQTVKLKFTLVIMLAATGKSIGDH